MPKRGFALSLIVVRSSGNYRRHSGGFDGCLGQSKHVEKQTRRQLFGGAAATVGAVALYQLLAGGNGPKTVTPSSSTVPLIKLDEGLAPQSFITPTEDFFRIDTAYPSIPELSKDSWQLKIHGMVDSEVTLSFADLEAMPQMSDTITLACVSNEVGGNEIGNAVWGGVSLADVLRMAGVQSGAEQLVSRSSDGWTCGTPVDAVMDGRNAMLVTTMNGESLTPKHGFPVRMIVPGLFGYVSATKWLVDLELTTWDAFDPYWVVRGWTPEGPVLSSSRIDLPRPAGKVKVGALTAGGFAWAPRAGVGKVQVRLNAGQWQDAEIVESHSGDAWAQWRADIEVAAGEQLLTVRVIDANGVEQVESEQGTFPSGATGLHSVKFSAA